MKWRAKNWTMVACVSNLTSGRRREGEERGGRERREEERGGEEGGGGEKREEGEEEGKRGRGEEERKGREEQRGRREKREERREEERREKREEELPVPLVSSSSAVLPSGGARTHCSIVLPWHWPVSWQEDQPSRPAAGNAAPVSFARGREKKRRLKEGGRMLSLLRTITR